MAINYQRVNWDTTMYVNPENMNQMDEGIEDACNGVDNLSTSVDERIGDMSTLPQPDDDLSSNIAAINSTLAKQDISSKITVKSDYASKVTTKSMTIKNGTVRLSLIIEGLANNIPSGSTIATIDAGYRPTTRIVFTPNADVFCACELLSWGDIKIYGTGTKNIYVYVSWDI